MVTAWSTRTLFVQDDWRVTHRLTLNLGLRYDNDLGIFNPDLKLKSGVATPHYNDNLLFQPRLGFAWDINGSRKTVIRGGAGLFYADIQANAKHYDIALDLLEKAAQLNDPIVPIIRLRHAAVLQEKGQDPSLPSLRNPEM